MTFSNPDGLPLLTAGPATVTNSTTSGNAESGRESQRRRRRRNIPNHVRRTRQTEEEGQSATEDVEAQDITLVR